MKYPPGYEEAQNGAVFFPIPDSGYLKINGGDRLSFLQRQTTNDIRQATPDRVVATVLTSPKARILDLLTLIAEPESIGAITLPGHAFETDSFLRKRIFFMDKVSLEDQSADFNQVDLIGPRADAFLRTMGLNEIPERGGIKTTTIEGSRVRILSTEKHNFRLFFPSALNNGIDNLLIHNGAVRLTEESFAVLQVESGIPRAGHELTSHYTPLEVNLEGLISDRKGCYTGQEVISRQLTYDKVSRKLVGLKLTSLAESGDKVFPPDRDRSIGIITSAVRSPRFGFIALAVINRRFSQPGTEVVYQHAEQSWSASVCNLPFR